MSEIKKDAEFWQRQTNILRAPKADLHTRLALVVADLGLTERQLQKFYKTGRRGKRFFDYFLFAQKQQISIEWLMDGVLSLHPRTPAAAKDRRKALRTVDAVQPSDGSAA
jgi:hypothetical protein